MAKKEQNISASRHGFDVVKIKIELIPVHPSEYPHGCLEGQTDMLMLPCCHMCNVPPCYSTLEYHTLIITHT